MENIPTLNQRSKWLAPQRNLKVWRFSTASRRTWNSTPACQSTDHSSFPDKFGHTRRVTAGGSDGKLHDREVAKICLLEADVEGEIGNRSDL